VKWSIIRAVKHIPTEYDKFTALVDLVLAVPHDLIKQRIEEHRRQAAANPNRPGPKPKKKVTKPSA
jgi:hypothetical protein